MYRGYFRPILLFGAISIVLGSSCNEKPTDKLTIAVAANMQFAMADLIKAFTSNTGIECQLVVGSSGKLTAQILQGAPFDVFLSADMKYPQEIYVKGLATAAPQIYSQGRLVLWSMKEGMHPSIELLQQESIKRVAIANPKTAPYGRAAMDVLEYHGIDQDLASKLIYGESISQVNQFVSTQAVDIGFTALSVVLSSQMKGKGEWIELSSDSYQSIDQGAAVIKRKGRSNMRGENFLDFLQSEESRALLNRTGYVID